MNEQLLTGVELVARFRAIRIIRGMSAQKVADASGISRGVLANLENGHRDTFTVDEAHAIADALHVDLIACLRPEPVVLTPAVTA